VAGSVLTQLPMRPMPLMPQSQSGPSHPDPPLRAEMPYKKMDELRDQVWKSMAGLSQAEALLVDVLRVANYPRLEIDSLQSDVRFKLAELVSLHKKLEPLAVNFRKFQAK
jgi:hypothetical protein